jgi:hypothetical protein
VDAGEGVDENDATGVETNVSEEILSLTLSLTLVSGNVWFLAPLSTVLDTLVNGKNIIHNLLSGSREQ